MTALEYSQITTIWLTPQHVLSALGEFDLDPCACSEPRPWATARRHISLPENGLLAPWAGRVWLNPPYDDTESWLERLARHGEGTALVFSRTETDAWHDWIWPHATAVRFLRKRLKFCRPNGTPARTGRAASALVAYGTRDADILRRCALPGVFLSLADVRERAVRTWRTAVVEAIAELGGQATLADMYAVIEGRRPTSNQFWRAKVRQQAGQHTLRVGPSTYRLKHAAA